MKKTNEKILIIRKKEGITLIALIITIIVLLILVGVAISAVVGDNGVLNQAVNAADRTEEERILEEIQLSVAAYQAGVHAGTETRTLSEYLSDELEIDAIRETNYGTLVFKAGTKVVTAYSNGELEIKEYQEKTLANNGPVIINGQDTEMTPDDGFLTDDGIARKYVKEIIFNTTNTAPNSYDYSWDVSELADGTVMAYAIGDETNGYDITIVADGEIYMPENSRGLFQYCGYNENLPEYTVNLSGLNASKSENMFNTFCDFGYYSMTSLDLGESFDTSNVTSMEGMFGRCGYMKMETIDLSNNFNTSKVTTMMNMFQQCGYNSMTRLELGEQFDTSKVTTMNNMFNSCGYISMINLDLGGNFETSNVSSMRGMFCDCGYTSMLELNLGDKFDTSNVTNMEAIFARCGYMNLETLNLGNNFNTSNVSNMRNAFLRCGNTKMTEIDFGNAFNDTSNITDFTSVLLYCGTSTCKYYVSSEIAQNWLLNLDSAYRRTENWNTEYIVVI